VNLWMTSRVFPARVPKSCEVEAKNGVVQWDANAEGRSTRRLTVPLPSITMKPNLESLSKSSAKASVWNLLSHRYNELHRINIVSHQYSGINPATTLFARPAETHVLIGL
jgi:hypothetical protein